MKIFIKIENGDTIELEVSGDFTIKELKKKIEKELDIPKENQIFLYGENFIINDTLKNNKIEEESTINLITFEINKKKFLAPNCSIYIYLIISNMR